METSLKNHNNHHQQESFHMDHQQESTKESLINQLQQKTEKILDKTMNKKSKSRDSSSSSIYKPTTALSRSRRSCFWRQDSGIAIVVLCARVMRGRERYWQIAVVMNSRVLGCGTASWVIWRVEAVYARASEVQDLKSWSVCTGFAVAVHLSVYSCLPFFLFLILCFPSFFCFVSCWTYVEPLLLFSNCHMWNRTLTTLSFPVI